MYPQYFTHINRIFTRLFRQTPLSKRIVKIPITFSSLRIYKSLARTFRSNPKASAKNFRIPLNRSASRNPRFFQIQNECRITTYRKRTIDTINCRRRRESWFGGRRTIEATSTFNRMDIFPSIGNTSRGISG